LWAANFLWSSEPFSKPQWVLRNSSLGALAWGHIVPCIIFS